MARARRGEVNVSNLVAILVVASVVYAAVIYVPVLADQYSVKEALATALTRARKSDDDQLRWYLLRDGLRGVGTHWEKDSSGILQELPGLDLKPDDIVIERNEPTVAIRVSYDRKIQLKPLQQFVNLHFTAEAKGVPP